MMPDGTTMRMRPAKLSYTEWKPSDGQLAAVDALCGSTRKALWADPGAGKTSITLAAFTALKSSGVVNTMLVVAPLRVCQLQWRQEAAQWTQFRHYKINFLHGPKKADLLREQADIYLINFDGLVWLRKQFRGNLPFDIVVIDESTKIKNYSAERSKALRNCTGLTPFKWMLTGTPNPNGYEDLFGQFLWLDEGQALGRFVTHFRDKYFKPSFNGFDYVLQQGGAARIEQRISHLVHRLPFTDLPPLSNDPRVCEMSPEGRKLYKAMAAEQVVVIGDKTIVAGSTGAHQSAKEQMANGAIYEKPGEEGYLAFDDAKLDALDELIEEMNGQPLMVAFQFHHDIERIKQRRGDKVAVLAGGVSAARAEEIQRAWNAGEIKELYVHPASIGHGLNLQRGGASHLCWFSATFDLELWEQLIRRLWRQGNKASRIVNHILVMKGTIDEDKLAAIEEKSVDQARLLQAMEKEPATAAEKETTMSDGKLPAQGGGNAWGGAAAPAPGSWGGAAAPAPQPAQGSWGGASASATQPAQGSWGQPQQPAAQQAPAPQPAQGSWGQQAIQTGGERIDPAQAAAQHFSPELRQQMASIGYVAPGSAPVDPQPPAPTGDAAKPKRARSTKPAGEDKLVAATETSEPVQRDAFPNSMPASVRVEFYGDPAAVKQAMRDFLNA